MPLADAGDLRLYYEIHGDAPGTPLLLISGMGGSCRGWLALQVPEFAIRHRTVIYDHRGVGESTDDGAPFSTADLADDAARVLDAAGIDRTHVLGAFMGGMVAQELARRHPERVDHLVLVGTYARPDGKRRMLLEKWREQMRHDVPLPVLGRERMLWTLSDETLEQSDLVEEMLSGLGPGSFPFTADTFARQCDACLGHDTLDRLEEIAQPTLIVCGQQDNLTPPELSRELAEGLPDPHLITIPQAAHLVMVETTKRFNQAVLQFLGDAR